MAVDYFLKLDGVPGESKDAKHKGELDVDSFAFGVARAGSSAGAGGGAGAGKASFQHLTVTARLSKASPTLMLACATGKHIKEAVLTARKAGKGQQDYYVIRLKDVVVTSYQVGGAEADGPFDQVALGFAQVQVEYRAQKADGSLEPAVKAGYDVKTGKTI